MIYENEIERRNNPGANLSLRPSGGPLPMIVGYGAVFDSLSEELRLNVDRTYREVIRPGAFAKSIADRDDVLARFEHAQLLGRTRNGTLRLTEDRVGLRYEIDPPDTSYARDLVKLIERRVVPFSSFDFRVRPGGDSWRRENGEAIRELRSVKLLDVSAVSAASYRATTVGLRSALGRFARWMKDRLRLADAESWQPASGAMADMARRLKNAERT